MPCRATGILLRIQNPLGKHDYMHNQPKARFVVPAATAILLTFGRDTMLPFEKLNTLLDQSMNIFVVVIAPLFALKGIYPRLSEHKALFFLPFLMLALWISVWVFVGSPREYWPAHTTLITIVLSVLCASQISSFELRRLRHLVLLISGVFSVYALVLAQSSLSLIFSGTLTTRLGFEVSNANLIILPRVMYMLVITCVFSLVIEKNICMRIYSTIIMILPMLVALATGGRGSLVGFFVAATVLVFGLRKKRKTFYGLLTVSAVIVTGYFAIDYLLPIMQNRIMQDQDSGRFDMWMNLLHSNFTWFGRGVTESYPHNIFLEFLLDYGFVGLTLFLIFFVTILVQVYRFYVRTGHEESLWVISLLVLQMTAQQFSLDIFYGGLWAALVLPIGFTWNSWPAQTWRWWNHMSEPRMS
jgi:hypothetical protein